MSKRKDIEFIHKVTGLSYGESRRLYKENGEDLYKALGLEESLKAISDIIPDVSETITNVINSMCKLINSIDWSNVYLREININELENVYLREININELEEGGDNE